MQTTLTTSGSTCEDLRPRPGTIKKFCYVQYSCKGDIATVKQIDKSIILQLQPSDSTTPTECQIEICPMWLKIPRFGKELDHCCASISCGNISRYSGYTLSVHTRSNFYVEIKVMQDSFDLQKLVTHRYWNLQYMPTCDL